MPLRVITVAFDDMEERFQDEELRAFLGKEMISYKAEYFVRNAKTIQVSEFAGAIRPFC